MFTVVNTVLLNVYTTLLTTLHLLFLFSGIALSALSVVGWRNIMLTLGHASSVGILRFPDYNHVQKQSAATLIGLKSTTNQSCTRPIMTSSLTSESGPVLSVNKY